ncbi:MAG: hypothetical protein KUG73_05575 [Pseudomonadales bacterium]|nr:hypothetical protein [Pseudomonadales bacterium]
MFKYIQATAFSLCVLLAANGEAEEAKYLDSNEIEALISGNSISGIYQGKSFKQNNHSGGIAVVSIQGSKIYKIPWMTIKNEYCENWNGNDWSCYKLKKREGNTVVAIKSDDNSLNVWRWHAEFIDINL